MPEPTEEELANGWTKRTLEAYHAERERAQSMKILDKPKKLPMVANNRYNPHRWRG